MHRKREMLPNLSWTNHFQCTVLGRDTLPILSAVVVVVVAAVAANLASSLLADELFRAPNGISIRVIVSQSFSYK